MKTLLYNVVIMILLDYIISDGCGLGFLKAPKRILVEQEGVNRRTLKEEEWQPLRVHLDYSYIENNIGMFNKSDVIDLKEKIMQNTKKVLEKLLKVKRNNGKLKLLHPKCEEYNIPELYQEEGEGVDADVVIFVNIDSSGFFMKNRIEAAAIHCLQDTVTRRPIAGYITFKPNLSVQNSTAADYMTWLAIHEITHVLVFNDALYEDFIDVNMNPIDLSKTLGKKLLPSGKKMSYLKTPKLLEKAKKHYGCNNFEGLPLEYNGGPGTAGAHWSKKYVNTDYMIGDSYGENLISELTLALFEDSGWYKVDYTKANLFVWGRNKGCEFLDINEKCVREKNGKLTTKFEPEFCTKVNYPVCSTSHIFRANCKVRKYQNQLLGYERYFEDSQLGGVDPLTDKCPIPIEERNKQVYYGGSCRVGTTNNISKLEKVCPECACFMSNLRESKSVKSFLRQEVYKTEIPRGPFVHTDLPNIKEEDMKANCYEFKCTGDDLHVVVEDKSYKCEETGLTKIDGYLGGIQCPPKDVLCDSKFKCKFGCVEEYSNEKGFLKFD